MVMNSMVKSRETNQEAKEITTWEMMVGLHLGSGSGHSKKYLGSGYILKVEPTEFTDGLKEVWKRGVKDEF